MLHNRISPEYLELNRRMHNSKTYGVGGARWAKEVREFRDRFEGVCSYKRDAREAPAGRIVCFHGKPNPPEADGWAAEHWSRHAVA